MVKQGFAMGRDIESMSGDLGRWLTACSDLTNLEKENQNPSIFKKIMNSKSIEAEAIEIYAAKKKLHDHRLQLKNYIVGMSGMGAWESLLKEEGAIRKRRQQQIYYQRELRRKIINYIAIAFLCITIIGFIIFLAYLYKENKGS